MRPELPTVSFVCAAILSVVIYKLRRSLEVPVFAILAWLLICNIIHGVNSLINQHYAPIWCDIATKLELATPLAVAIAGTCLSCRLELESSKRESRIRDVWRIRVEALACVGLPIMYLLLSILVQNHRFDIIQDMGCEASIFISVPSAILLWLPILLLCFVTVIFSSIVSARLWRQRADFFFHVAGRSRLAGLDFQVLLCMTVVQALLLVYVMLSNVALSDVQPWTSLYAVHADIGRVEVISTDTITTRQRVKLELDWWLVPTLSLVSLVSLAFGASLRIWLQSFAGRFRRPSLGLPMHTESMYSGRDSLLSPLTPKPVQLQKAISSDSLHPSRTKEQPTQLPLQDLAPSPSPLPANDPDVAFMNSTLAYLGSPTARHCGLPLPSQPPSIYVTHSQDYMLSSRPSTDGSSRDPRRESNGTLASSILAGPWPQPPVDVPLYGPRSGIVPMQSSSRSQPLLKPVYRRSSLTGRGRPSAVKRNAGGTIYMTVVKESVA